MSVWRTWVDPAKNADGVIMGNVSRIISMPVLRSDIRKDSLGLISNRRFTSHVVSNQSTAARSALSVKLSALEPQGLQWGGGSRTIVRHGHSSCCMRGTTGDRSARARNAVSPGAQYRDHTAFPGSRRSARARAANRDSNGVRSRGIRARKRPNARTKRSRVASRAFQRDIQDRALIEADFTSVARARQLLRSDPVRAIWMRHAATLDPPSLRGWRRRCHRRWCR